MSCNCGSTPSPKSATAGASCCCPGGCRPQPPPAWQTGWIAAATGPVPRVDTRLTAADRCGAVRVRCNLGRMNYKVPPGLYAVGAPDATSPTLVTANYKLTFDRLRKELGGQNAWLLVLDTDGINVWCAAGKGSFGTEELLRRLRDTRLEQVTTNRTLVLPQLGAPGVAAHTVQKESGFRVVYGPVYARDIPAFLAAGMRATPAMRRVRFTLRERLAVVPVELTQWLPYLAILALALILTAGLWGGAGWSKAGGMALLVAAAGLTGSVGTPALLPWLPGRAFAVKGAALALALTAGLQFSGLLSRVCAVRGGWELAAWWLLIPAIASFLALNYTGTSTFTSQSGVKKELRFALPAQAAGLFAGLTLFVIAQCRGG